MRMGMIAIDRKGGKKALQTMVQKAKMYLSHGRPIVIFPEGTRSDPGKKGKYHAGVAILYDHLKVPVIPMALNSGLCWGRRSFLKHPGVIRVEFLPPIPTELSKNTFLERLSHDIEDACERLIKTPATVS
jgi:1-acyl-sn-glycerol-3-phosphate acyltransferase